MMRSVPCSVCGSTRQKYFLNENECTMVTCVECDHLHTSPLPELDFSAAKYEASGNWIKVTDITEPSGADTRLRLYAETLGQILPPRATVVEVGCSKGRFLYLL